MHEMYDKTKDAFIVSTLLLRNGDGLMAMRKMVRMWRKVHELTDDWHMNHHHFNHNRSLRRKQDQIIFSDFKRTTAFDLPTKSSNLQPKKLIEFWRKKASFSRQNAHRICSMYSYIELIKKIPHEIYSFPILTYIDKVSLFWRLQHVQWEEHTPDNLHFLWKTD